MSSLLPISTRDRPRSPRSRTRLRRPQRPVVVVLVVVTLLILFNLGKLNVLKRDIGYILRPLWDSGEPPFNVIPHFPQPNTLSGSEPNTNQAWCRLHGWTARGSKPVMVDAVPIATELDMLEIRMREYAPHVSIFIIVEADMTHAGTPKPLHFANNRRRFQAIADANGARIVYKTVTGFTPNLPKGSFQNEIIQRQAIQSLIEDERRAGAIPPGSVIIESDVDEVISRDTLRLLSACHVPQNLHLNVRNYRYSYNQPLMDEGYWRPRAVTVGSGPVLYTHARESDNLLMDAGWHCSFCFATLEDMRAKMRGYVHNDRLTRGGLLEEKALRKRVCRGQDPFGMWAEAFTLRDVLIQSGDVRPSNSFLHLPVALRDQPGKFGYLLDKGCERPDH